jgi:N-acyl-D-aspartate/D-glutamate deacylase
MWADIVVFDLETIRDRASFDRPDQVSEGVLHVLINGVAVMDHGKPTQATPGRVLTPAADGRPARR